MAVEGGNELDYFYWHRCQVSGRHCTVAEWAERIRTSVREATAWLDANGFSDIPLIGPSFVNRDISWDAGIPDAKKVGDLSAWVDYGNAHPYSGGQAPEVATRTGKEMAATNAPGKPVWFTEWGFHTASQGAGPHPGVSESVQANYLVRGWLDYFDQGIKGAAVYEFLDEHPDGGADGENSFGLVRRDWTTKPAYSAMKTMLSYGHFDDTATAFTIPATKITVSTAAGVPIRAAALQNSRGHNVIAVWRPESLWNRDTYQPVDVARAAYTVTICRPDLRWGVYLDTARPVTGNYTRSGPSPHPFTDAAGMQGCRRFSGRANGEPQLLLQWH